MAETEPMGPTIKTPEAGDGSLSTDQAKRCQEALDVVFDAFGLHVSTGLTQHGVAIISQDQRVDARTMG